jgi:hypothetical protein
LENSFTKAVSSLVGKTIKLIEGPELEDSDGYFRVCFSDDVWLHLAISYTSPAEFHKLLRFGSSLVKVDLLEDQFIIEFDDGLTIEVCLIEGEDKLHGDGIVFGINTHDGIYEYDFN